MKKKYLEFYNNKKGFADFLLVAIVLFVLAIMVIVTYKIINEFNDTIQGQSSVPDDEKAILNTIKTNYVAVWDGLFLLFFILIFIVLLVSASLLDAHPAFFIVMVVITIITGFIGMHLANTYSIFIDEFTIMPFFFKNFPTVLIIMGMTTAIVLYFRPRE